MIEKTRKDKLSESTLKITKRFIFNTEKEGKQKLFNVRVTCGYCKAEFDEVGLKKFPIETQCHGCMGELNLSSRNCLNRFEDVKLSTVEEVI